MNQVADYWSKIAALPSSALTQLFANDAERIKLLSLDVGGIYFDFAKTHLTGESMTLFAKLAEAMDL